MKIRNIAKTIIFCLLSGLNLTAEGYFLPEANGVRPAGMGEAYVAVADDANAMLFNPAGLANLTQVEMTGMYSDLYSNLNARLYTGQSDRSGYNFISLAVPVEPVAGVFGLGWTQLSSAFYQENTFTLSYGRKVWEPEVWGMKMKWDAGINVKSLQWLVETNDFTTDENFFPYAERSKTGFTADLGILIRILPGLNAGFSVDNVLPVDMGLTTTEITPMVFRLGLAYQLLLAKFYIDDIRLAWEADARDDFSQDIYTPKFGTEAWFFRHLFAWRAGVTRWQVSSGLSVHYAWPQTPLTLQVDYAFAYPFYILDSGGSHRVGLTFRWDLHNYEGREAAEKSQARQAVNEIKGKLSQASSTSQAALKQAQDAVESAGKGEANAKKTTQEAWQQCLEAAKTADLAAEQAKSLGQKYSDLIFQELITQAISEAKNIKSTSDQIGELIYRADDAYINSVISKVINQKQVEANKPIILPEANDKTITVGIERRIYADYGNYENTLEKLRRLQNYIQSRVNLKLSWVEYQNPGELFDALQEGKLDLFVTYDEAYRPLYARQAIRPVLTMQRHGQITQTCCLIVRKDSPIENLQQLQGKVVGCARQKLFNRVLPYFSATEQMALRREFYLACMTQSDVISALWALQAQDIQVLLEFEYILDICEKMKKEMPIGVKVLARSRPIVNTPLFIRTSRNRHKNQQMQKALDALVEAHTQPALHDFFKFFQIDSFVRFDEEKFGNDLR